MSNQTEMTSDQKAQMRKKQAENIKRFWPIYVFLFFTAALSFISGLILPFMREDVKVLLNWGTALVALYYAIGFLSNGELMSGFWFGKLTDQDEDNTSQKIIAWSMLAISTCVVLATCVSAADMIAFWMGSFDAFYQIPVWVQKYVVYLIPVGWVVNWVMAVLFHSVSNEAIMAREQKARISKAMSDASIIEAQAYADQIVANAPALAKEKGRIRAQAEIDLMQADVDQRTSKLAPRRSVTPSVSYNQDVRQPTMDERIKELEENNPSLYEAMRQGIREAQPNGNGHKNTNP